MKNEDFDEAIRNKLEGLEQKYSQADIDKTVDQLRRRGAFSPRGFSGSLLLYTVAAAAVLVGVFWSVLQLTDSAKVAHSPAAPASEISTPQVEVTIPADTLPEQAKTVQPEVAAPKAGFSMPSHPATVMFREESQSKSLSSEDVAMEVASHKREDAVLLNKIIPEIQHPADENLQHPENIAENKAFTDTVRLPSEAGQWIQTLADTASTSKVISQDKDSYAKESAAAISGSPAEGNNNPAAAGVVQVAGGEVVDGKQSSPGHQGGNISGSILIGGGFEYARSGVGAGVDLGVKLPKRLILNAGLRYVSLNDELFADKDAFDRHDTGKINHHFNDQLMHHDHIRDIVIHSQLLQVPLSIGYSIPLKKGYSFTFSLGTDLDVFLSQRLTFSQPPDSIRPPHGDLRDKGKAVLFNNMVITGSVEKEYKRFVFSVSPFIRPQLQQVFYKPKELDFGIALRVYFRPGL